MTYYKGDVMVATVRLNEELEELLNRLTKKFHKKKSDIMREALRYRITAKDALQKDSDLLDEVLN